MGEESYPLNQKMVTLQGQKVTLRELPVAYIISVENKLVEDSLFSTCKEGSNATEEILGQLGGSQLQAMYDDIMILSYGVDWKKQAEQGSSSKKK